MACEAASSLFHEILRLYALYSSMLYAHYNGHNEYMQDLFGGNFYDCLYTALENLEKKRISFVLFKLFLIV